MKNKFKLCFVLFFFLSFKSLCAEGNSDASFKREKLLSLAMGEWVAKSIHTAAKLDIASLLYAGPTAVSELAKLTHSHEESLYRLMRMLASVDIFHEGENRVFSNTPASELLASRHPQSLRHLILFYGQEMSQSWSWLTDCVREGKPGFDIGFQQPVFPYFREHPQSGSLFHLAMQEKSKVVIASCLESYDFGNFSSVYDIGGGMGHFLAALLKKYPQMHAVLFDLPEVVASAPSIVRCQLHSGDFFQEVPSGGDAYLLKSVIHDWSDKDALAILKNCHQAMGKDAKLLIIEPVMTAANQKDNAKFMDVYMMLITGGKERTVEDFRILLDEAGFSINSVTATETEFYLIEARKE